MTRRIHKRGDHPPHEEGGPRVENYRVERRRGGAVQRLSDVVAVETPVALSYNGVSHAVMMASPADLEDFALGFSLSERIIDTPDEVYGFEVIERAQGVEVAIEISSARMGKLRQLRRNLAGRTGCGLCGAETLEQAVPKLSELENDTTITYRAVPRALTEMERNQPTQALTGAIHAAAWADRNGALHMLCEDVGRHNALDKLIGALYRTNRERGRGFVVVTSRASYEMVQKTVTVGIPILAAVSAPTSLAIRLAREAGLTLVGFARGQDFVVYANGRRILNEASAGREVERGRSDA